MRTITLRARTVLPVAFIIITMLYIGINYRQVYDPKSFGFPIASIRLKTAPKTSAGKMHGNKTKIPLIPHIIHQTWKTNKVPILFRPWVQSWFNHNKGWEYWFWTDSDMRNLIGLKYPEYLSLYDSYPDSVYRVDAFRYFLLYEYGGVYADLDVECLKPLDPVTWKHDCVISQEPAEHAHFLTRVDGPLASNALMACRPKHAFFEYIIENLEKHKGYISWKDVLHATGPIMLTEVLEKYRNRMSLSARHKEPIHIAHADEFQPTIDESMLDKVREMCITPPKKWFPSKRYIARQQTVCRRLLGFQFSNTPKKMSYTDHHWTHSWAGRRFDPWGILNTDTSFFIGSLT